MSQWQWGLEVEDFRLLLEMECRTGPPHYSLSILAVGKGGSEYVCIFLELRLGSCRLRLLMLAPTLSLERELEQQSILPHRSNVFRRVIDLVRECCAQAAILTSTICIHTPRRTDLLTSCPFRRLQVRSHRGSDSCSGDPIEEAQEPREGS